MAHRVYRRAAMTAVCFTVLVMAGAANAQQYDIRSCVPQDDPGYYERRDSVYQMNDCILAPWEARLGRFGDVSTTGSIGSVRGTGAINSAGVNRDGSQSSAAGIGDAGTFGGGGNISGGRGGGSGTVGGSGAIGAGGAVAGAGTIGGGDSIGSDQHSRGNNGFGNGGHDGSPNGKADDVR